MSIFTLTGRPPWAVVMWADESSIYMELPVKDSPPYIQKFPYSEAGLSKALNTMHNVYEKLGAHEKKNGGKRIVTHPLLEKRKPKDAFSTDQRTAARDVLRKLGLIGK